MDREQFVDYILSHMERAKTASGGSVINCRCPECGDSIHKTSAHFYINVPDGVKPIFYYCHKCNSGGIINHKKLIEWDIFNPEVAQYVNDYNMSVSHNKGFSKYSNRTVYRVSHSICTMNENSEYKRKYICDRLGYELSFQELAQLKIIINLGDLLNENRIRLLTRHENIVNELNKYFIGFLSVDNAFLNMRRTVDEGIVFKGIDKRYINYALFDKVDTSQRFYTIPTMVDLSIPERIKIHIAEGPFDILSVYLNLRNRDHGIYTCVAGNNYISVIMYFLIELQIPWVELHFYVDNDRYGTVDRITDILNRVPDKTIPAYIHMNKTPGEKDFGVPRNRINETIMQIR